MNRASIRFRARWVLTDFPAFTSPRKTPMASATVTRLPLCLTFCSSAPCAPFMMASRFSLHCQAVSASEPTFSHFCFFPSNQVT